MEDVGTWLKSIDLQMYSEAFRSNKIDGNILYNDLKSVSQLTALGVNELHANKLLREIKMLRMEQRNAELEDMRNHQFNRTNSEPIDEEETKLNLLVLDPFEMIRQLFNEMDQFNREFIDREGFDYALEVAGVKTLTKEQVDIVFHQFHFSTENGITEEEMLLALGKVFVQHSCTDAKMAFRLTCVLFLQNAGMIQGYSVCAHDD